MDSLFDELGARAKAFAASGKLRVVVALLIVLGLGLAIAGIFIPYMPALQVTLGSLGGLSIFIAGYMFWYAGLNTEHREKLNFRAHIPLGRRRALVVVAALMWILILWAVGSRLGSSLLGAFNVAIILTLWRLFTATGQERVALDERLERIWVERQEQRPSSRLMRRPRRRLVREERRKETRAFEKEGPQSSEYEIVAEEEVYYYDGAEPDTSWDDEPPATTPDRPTQV